MQQSPLFSLYRTKYSLTSAKPSASSQGRRLWKMTYSLVALFLYLTEQGKVEREIQETEKWDEMHLRLGSQTWTSNTAEALTQADHRVSVCSLLYVMNNNWALQCSLYNELLKIRFGALAHHVVSTPYKLKTQSAVNSCMCCQWETAECCGCTQAEQRRHTNRARVQWSACTLWDDKSIKM